MYKFHEHHIFPGRGIIGTRVRNRGSHSNEEETRERQRSRDRDPRSLLIWHNEVWLSRSPVLSINATCAQPCMGSPICTVILLESSGSEYEDRNEILSTKTPNAESARSHRSRIGTGNGLSHWSIPLACSHAVTERLLCRQRSNHVVQVYELLRIIHVTTEQLKGSNRLQATRTSSNGLTLSRQISQLREKSAYLLVRSYLTL